MQDRSSPSHGTAWAADGDGCAGATGNGRIPNGKQLISGEGRKEEPRVTPPCLKSRR